VKIPLQASNNQSASAVKKSSRSLDNLLLDSTLRPAVMKRLGLQGVPVPATA
jgi:hypothetical protein